MRNVVKAALVLSLGLGVSATNAALLEIIPTPPNSGIISVPGGLVGTNEVFDTFNWTGNIGDAYRLQANPGKYPLKLTWWYGGSESGFDNTLVNPLFTETDTIFADIAALLAAGPIGMTEISTPGIIDIGFTSSGFAGTLTTGDCRNAPLAPGATCDPGIALAYLSELADGATLGVNNHSDIIVFALDDGEASDDDYDDFVGIITVEQIPVPAPLFLIGSVLLGFAFLSRGRRAYDDA